MSHILIMHFFQKWETPKAHVDLKSQHPMLALSNSALPTTLTVSSGLRYGMLQDAFAVGMCV